MRGVLSMADEGSGDQHGVSDGMPRWTGWKEATAADTSADGRRRRLAYLYGTDVTVYLVQIGIRVICRPVGEGGWRNGAGGGGGGGGGFLPTAVPDRAGKMSFHPVHYVPVGDDGTYALYAPIGPYPPPHHTASAPRLTREQHLVALRIQLSEDLRGKYDCEGYWAEAMRRYTLAGMPEHRSLDRTLPELDREFEEWLRFGQSSRTAGGCEDELTLARREWASLRAHHDQLPPMEETRRKAQGMILAWDRDVGAARRAEAEQQERKRARYTCEDLPANRKVPDGMGGDESISVLAPNEDDSSLDATSAHESDEDIPTESDGGLLSMPPPSDSDRSSSVSEPRTHDAVTESLLQRSPDGLATETQDGNK
ncbi:hypothetical protein KC343_g15698 [Hortaea werneckii]|nr:hypothetical protein KC317_g15766 [Hortaea werneckii]KAI7600316.1 hypothetical protein KC343_g15698 [Hortaea werneckii]KAI7635328.1 hypothetical protein KC319_g15486 [Hortaea werneckii]KAI7675175.1 hypothetical protein KC322_g15526 [Hortaea werneckii]